ncbi:MAG: helix-turn-helix transcriptional regulator [Alphaproteobacteria bacterium]|nr:helix-turn-helix transcriptional regulator [Alphaproteobacteria bacterium]
MEQVRALVEDVVQRLGGDAGWFMRFVRPLRSDGLYVVDLVALGPPGFHDALSVLAHRDLTPWNLDVGDGSSLNAFDLRVRSEVPHHVAEAFWDPFGLNSSLSMNVVAGNRVAGNVGILRASPRAPFKTADQRRANRRRDRIRVGVEGLELRRGPPRPDVGSIVLTASGAVRFASPDVHDVPELLALVQAEVRAHGAGAHRALVGRHLVTFEPLDPLSADQEAMVLARVEATVGMQAVQAMTMSRVKRKVADLAARGATVPEIASHLGRAPDTIRAHLKDVYRELGVGNRVELADAVRGIWS